jgi:predicted RNA-binding Zn-ribbon protein involved in translation (DUF1610 family)
VISSTGRRGRLRRREDARIEPDLHKKTFTQRLFTRLMPGRAEAIERESREWKLICPNCGNETSIWEIGGVRYKAKSRGERMGAKCPACGKRSMHRVERRRGESGDPGRPA